MSTTDLSTNPKAGQKAPEDKAQDTRKGIMATVVSGLFIAVSRLGVKHLYDAHPSLGSV